MTQILPPKSIFRNKLILLGTPSLIVSGLICVALLANITNAQVSTGITRLDVARLGSDNTLSKPADLDQWIHLGSNLGQGYSDTAFSEDNPGTFQIVEMEPSAYAYFKENGSYADGTMLALSFWRSETKESPRLNGFSQGDMVNYEIHLIDSSLNEAGRQFYIFDVDDREAAPLNDQSGCVSCHLDEGGYQSTFTQFYPKMKSLLTEHGIAVD
ncbi:MAG: hypothetical protein COC19_06060 [SAR86 cluster bacterium]|uniref:Cytochrome P460 domain-containing protein n=1 Tax=SAR86 cluster bacterium TaxID=2030880 RepID=A0A2A4MJE4_9GAMM|nr:MAG: hypothetical protein COC19_06060 [SAR86 cluster bacterium]